MAKSTFGMLTIKRIFFILAASFSLLAQLSASLAEQNDIISEASYTMGDGETPSFAEVMVLQKAKQIALEAAGTYVQSYTKVQNFDLTTDEIQTIAGGVMKVEILQKTRTQIGDNLRFYTKIRATITTDQMEELARRIKGKDVAEDYKRLQGEYARLNRELEDLKQSLAKVPTGPERETALDQLREREKNFMSLQKSEVALFERLISGETLFSKALGQVSLKEKERVVVDALFDRILAEGHTISLGEPQIHTMLQNRDMVGISVPVTVQASSAIEKAMEDTARTLGGSVFQARVSGAAAGGLTLRMGNNLETVKHFQERVANLIFVLEARLEKGASLSCYLPPEVGFGFSVRGRLGINSVSQLSSFGNEAKIDGLGLSQSFSRDSFSSSGIPKLQEEDGFVVVFDYPASSTLQMDQVPLQVTKQITALTGKIVEGVRNKFGTVPSKTIPKCTVLRS